MYCKENRELLHKYYAAIAKERMHPDDHHLIERHKALLPTFEHEKDAESNIELEWGGSLVKSRVMLLGYYVFTFSGTIKEKNCLHTY